MASRYEVEVTVDAAKNLKNVNWRNGDLHPYCVLYINDGPRVTTRADMDNDENPIWEEKLLLPLPSSSSSSLHDAELHLDVVHANPSAGVKPLVGSATLPLREIVDEVGVGGGKAVRSLKLRRPSGRPHGKIDLKVAIKEPHRYTDDQYAPPPYGQPAASRGYSGEQSYGGYSQPYTPPSGYPYGAPPPAYGAPPPAYGAPPPAYGAPLPPPAYGSGGSYESYGYGGGAAAAAPVEQQKKGKLGMGAGLAIGAVGGVLGGLALAEGIDYVEDKIEDDVAEKVEDDLAYGGDDYDDGGDW